MSQTITLTDLQAQEIFNALLERKHRLSMELRHHRDELKDWELAQTEEALQGTREALDVLQAAIL